MMRRLAVLAGVVLAISHVGAGRAEAQFVPFVPEFRNNIAFSIDNYLYNRPTVSPYLNLSRTNSGSFLPNYHALVRPELQRREQAARQTAHIARNARQLQQVQRDLRQTQDRQRRMGLVTGHPTRFMSYLHYYPQPRAR